MSDKNTAPADRAYGTQQAPLISGGIASELAPFVGLVYSATSALDDSWANDFFSRLLSIPLSLVQDSTPSDLSVLENTQPFAAPDAAYQAQHSPTVSEFVNASNASYALGVTPEGLTPFAVDGKQLSINDQASGMAAKVWKTEDNQLIIAYNGTTGGDTLLLNPFQLVGELLADLLLLGGSTAPADQDSVDFAQYVVQQAKEQGIASQDVFVTGHSLGGQEAEYVAQQTGLGGLGDEPNGLPASTFDSAVGDGSNFVNLLTYGDGFGDLASDIQGLQPYAPDFAPDNGELPHYGTNILLGDVDNQNTAVSELTTMVHYLGNTLGFAAYLIGEDSFHFPNTQARLLGVDLQPASVLVSALAALNDTSGGQVFDVENSGIGEVIAANGQRSDYHFGALPDSSHPLS